MDSGHERRSRPSCWPTCRRACSRRRRGSAAPADPHRPGDADCRRCSSVSVATWPSSAPTRLGTRRAGAVTSRVGAALQAGHRVGPGRPAHAVDAPALHVLGLMVGLGAALSGVIVGTSMLVRGPAPALSVGPTAEHITVSRPSPRHPAVGSADRRAAFRIPDYGPLTDPQRRPPASTVWGTRRPPRCSARGRWTCTAGPR